MQVRCKSELLFFLPSKQNTGQGMIKSPARLVYVLCSNLSQQLEDADYQTDTIQPDEIKNVIKDCCNHSVISSPVSSIASC